MSTIVKTEHRPIKTLSPQLANQIAAGEVVERPASVVKELVENSLDAGATQVHIEIDQGGQKRILIRDNGKGIVKDELTLALSRHATSKISNINDLENITSMGFRGEALASISSVSRLTLTSKPKQQAQAWQARTEGQQMAVEVTPAAHPDGTSIEVLDLFFNTPARRKFLRTGKTEFQHIEAILKRLALTSHQVQFSLVHNNKQVFKYSACEQLARRIEQVCGKAILEKAVPVDYQFEGVHLFGWCSELGFGAATRDYQYTFVNGRMMRDKLLAHAIRQVFEETLPPQTFPTYVLFLTLAPDQLDVNVHPAKHEVRFHETRKIHDLVFKGVSDALSASGSSSEAALSSITHSTEPKHDYIQPLREAAQLNTYSQSQHQAKTRTAYSGGHHAPTPPSKTQLRANHQFYQSVHEQAQQVPTSDIQFSQYLLALPYVVFSENSDLRVIKVVTLLSMYLQAKIGQSTTPQPLLMPVSVKFPEDTSAPSIEGFINKMTEINVIIDIHANKLILKQVPSELRQLPWASLFSSIVADIKTEQSNNPELDKYWFTDSLASAWLALIDSISQSQIDVWLQEIGKTQLAVILQGHGKSIKLKELFDFQTTHELVTEGQNG